MERKMESRGATRTGIAPLYTRFCARCSGLLVNDWCSDLANGGHNAEVLRCVQCGNHVDLVIAQNRIRTLDVKNHVPQMQSSRSAKIGFPMRTR